MKQIKKSFQALGTVNSITVIYEEVAEKQVIVILDEIKAKVLELDNLLSVFKESSDISRINSAAGKELIPVKQATYYIVKKAVEYSEITDGTFDITTRPLSKLWGIGKKGEFIPTKQEIMDVLRLVNYRDIIFKDNARSIGLRRSGQAIDLGSIAKGYAADMAKNRLIEKGIINAVINFGGSVIVLGEERRVGVQDPEKKTGSAMSTLRLKDRAIVTSGWYERYFMKDGRRYHHIIDPRTGEPADRGISSISLVGNSAMELDALTTAIFVSGISQGLQYLDRYHLEGIIVSNELDVFITKGLQDKFTLINEKESKEYETVDA